MSAISEAPASTSQIQSPLWPPSYYPASCLHMHGCPIPFTHNPLRIIFGCSLILSISLALQSSILPCASTIGHGRKTRTNQRGAQRLEGMEIKTSETRMTTLLRKKTRGQETEKSATTAVTRTHTCLPFLALQFVRLLLVAPFVFFSHRCFVISFFVLVCLCLFVCASLPFACSACCLLPFASFSSSCPPAATSSPSDPTGRRCCALWGKTNNGPVAIHIFPFRLLFFVSCTPVPPCRRLFYCPFGSLILSSR